MLTHMLVRNNLFVNKIFQNKKVPVTLIDAKFASKTANEQISNQALDLITLIDY